MLRTLERRVRRLGTRVGRSLGAVQDPAGLRALSWIRDNRLPGGGIRVETGHPHAYPEVTGYLIPTLLTYGEEELANDLVEWLICIQRADGSFTDPDAGRSFTFDTGQVLRGLLAIGAGVAGAEEAARRAADYLAASLVDSGRGGFPAQYAGTDCPESVQLYVLPPLVEAADRLQRPRYRDLAFHALDHYVKRSDCLRLDDLTHFLAYELDALIDLGRADLAQHVLADLAALQQADGSVRGRGGASWVCTPGLAQLAICWYKAGMPDPADRAMAWLDRHQEADGGFRGSYGSGAAYKARVEISWAPKFVLDAHVLRVNAFFAQHVGEFPTHVAVDDGRLLAVSGRMRPGDRVLEIGCGKGRFLKALSGLGSDISCHGVDPSLPLLASVPGTMATAVGTLENIPHPDNSFDIVFAVESLEHSVVPMRGLAEMVRVARPGGWIVVVDKHRGAWGRMACPPWERWPDNTAMLAALRVDCDDVSSQSVSFDGHPASDGLMMAWTGRKRSRLSGAEWNKVLIGAGLEQQHVDEIRFNEFSDWGRTMLLETRPADRVLEIGSGTGKISLQLALAGRNVSCLDSSADTLSFTRRCAAELGLQVQTICGDATTTLPFDNGAFDCVWSSGLLEHFTADERQAMLRQWARVCRGRLISLVPNAASVAYRIGKRAQERDGIWPYGLETPIQSLRDDYVAAGLRVETEFSVGARHSLNFLRDRPIRRALAGVFLGLSRRELRDWNQGYLLVTIGTMSSESAPVTVTGHL